MDSRVPKCGPDADKYILECPGNARNISMSVSETGHLAVFHYMRETEVLITHIDTLAFSLPFQLD
jgi:hypothetical protein